MAGMITALYDRMESYEEIAICYGSLKEALKEEKHRGDLLEQKLSTLWDPVAWIFQASLRPSALLLSEGLSAQQTL